MPSRVRVELAIRDTFAGQERVLRGGHVYAYVWPYGFPRKRHIPMWKELVAWAEQGWKGGPYKLKVWREQRGKRKRTKKPALNGALAFTTMLKFKARAIRPVPIQRTLRIDTNYYEP